MPQNGYKLRKITLFYENSAFEHLKSYFKNLKIFDIFSKNIRKIDKNFEYSISNPC